MTSLLDIGPLTVPVTVRGKEIQVGGISGAAFLELLDRFPEFRKVMSGGMVEFDAPTLMKQVPGAVGAVVAHVTGDPGNKQVEELALNLAVGEQLEIINAAWGLTFPKGVRAFLETLESLARQVAPDDIGWARDTISPEPSSN